MTFSTNDIPNLSGKVIIVTGGNSGLGKETVKVLLEHNATVYLATRGQEKAQSVISELKELTGREALFLKLDLSSFHSIKAAVEAFGSMENRLDALINNAGLIFPPNDELTAEGYDMTMATNLLGPFYLTKLLLPILSATGRLGNGPSRVVNLSSALHLVTKYQNVIECCQDTTSRKKAGPEELYNVSKFGIVMYTNELARRYNDGVVVSMSVHPGLVKTDLNGNAPGFVGSITRAMVSSIGIDIQQGALTQLYAATMPEAAKFNGKYLIPWGRVGKPHPTTEDPKAGHELFEWLEDQVKHV